MSPSIPARVSADRRVWVVEEPVSLCSVAERSTNRPKMNGPAATPMLQLSAHADDAAKRRKTKSAVRMIAVRIATAAPAREKFSEAYAKSFLRVASRASAHETYIF